MRVPGWMVRVMETGLPIGDDLGTRDGRDLRMIEVESIYLRLRSQTERKRVLRAEEELYNSLHFPLMRLTWPAEGPITSPFGYSIR